MRKLFRRPKLWKKYIFSHIMYLTRGAENSQVTSIFFWYVRLFWEDFEAFKVGPAAILYLGMFIIKEIATNVYCQTEAFPFENMKLQFQLVASIASSCNSATTEATRYFAAFWNLQSSRDVFLKTVGSSSCANGFNLFPRFLDIWPDFFFQWFISQHQQR